MTAKEIIDYMKTNGAESAYGLLLLCGPDGFDGTYDEYRNLLIELEVE